MERTALRQEPVNGGFPEPRRGEPAQLLSARHEACGSLTRVRVPRSVPVAAVRRVQCDACAVAYDAEGVVLIPERFESLSHEELAAGAGAGVSAPHDIAPPLEPPGAHPELSLPAPGRESRRRLSLKPEGRAWRWASLALAAAGVIAVLLAVRGGEEDEPATAGSDAGAAAEAVPEGEGAGSGADGKDAKGSELVRGSQYSLALPAGWERIEPPSGATFAAVSPEGAADATLWIDEDPRLDYPTFVSRSLEQLEALAGSSRVVERIPGPTPETTIVRLAADAPPGQPSYEVTLRAAGPYRYYLATTVEPEAPAAAIAGVDLIVGSFAPTAEAAQ